MTTEPLSEPTDDKAGRARTRSPAYPALSLKTAIEKARSVWEHEKRNAAPIEALASDWASNAKSSATLLALSALKKFDLLVEVDGGKDRLLKLTDTALNILLNDDENSAERAALIKRCALTPKIHAELWKQFNGDLPSETNLNRYLIIEKAFNPDSVAPFIKQFKDTIAFAKLSPSDKIEEIVPPVEELEERDTPLLKQKRVTESIKAATKPGTVLGEFLSPSPISVLREFNFPLPTGVATLKVPFPFTDEDFDTLLKTLNTFKDGLVKRPDPVVLENVEGWQAKAKALAGHGIEFNLSGFDYSFDIVAATEFATSNKLDLRLDLNKRLALFRKKSEKPQ